MNIIFKLHKNITAYYFKTIIIVYDFERIRDKDFPIVFSTCERKLLSEKNTDKQILS